MMPFRIGDSSEYIAVEHAKSGRSTCKVCKQLIQKESVRVGLLLDQDHFGSCHWFHQPCFQFKPRHKILEVDTLQQKLSGIKDLDPSDTNRVINSLKQRLRAYKESGPKKVPKLKAKPAKQMKPKSKSISPKRVEQKKQAIRPKSTKIGLQKQKQVKNKSVSQKSVSRKSRSDKSKSFASKNSQKIQVERNPLNLRNTRSRNMSVKQPVIQKSGKKNSINKLAKSINKKQVVVGVKGIKGGKGVKNKVIKQEKKKFLTQQQRKQYKQLLNQYSKLTIDKLKNILQQNRQPKTGTKDDLINKCADGKQFGKIPTCTKCGGGKLRFERTNGTYKCPGFMEDTDFRNCHTIFTFDQVSRDKWLQQ